MDMDGLEYVVIWLLPVGVDRLGCYRMQLSILIPIYIYTLDYIPSLT